MKPVSFDYATAASSAAASALLAEAVDGAKPIAGGQSLGPMLNLRLARPSALVDVSRASDMRTARDEGDAIFYGGAVTHAEIEDGDVPDATPGWLAAVARRIAYRAVRNRGTIAGSLVHADPAADWPLALATLDATIHIRGPRGTRTVSAADFMIGAFTTVLEESELIEAVQVPRPSPAARWGYYKVMRKTGEYADAFSIAVQDRGALRIVAGATDGAPIVLDQTAQAVLANAAGADLAKVVEQELAAAGREFSVAKALLHKTAVLRAIEDLRKK